MARAAITFWLVVPLKGDQPIRDQYSASSDCLCTFRGLNSKTSYSSVRICFRTVKGHKSHLRMNVYLGLVLLAALSLPVAHGLFYIIGECEPRETVLNNFVISCRDGSLILLDGRRITADYRLCKRRFGRWVCGGSNKEVQFDPISEGTRLGEDLIVMKTGDVFYGNGLVHHWDGTVSINNLNCRKNLFFSRKKENARVKLADFTPREFPCCAKITPLDLFCMFKDGAFKVTSQESDSEGKAQDTETWIASQSRDCVKRIVNDPGDREMFDYYQYEIPSH